MKLKREFALFVPLYFLRAGEKEGLLFAGLERTGQKVNFVYGGVRARDPDAIQNRAYKEKVGHNYRSMKGIECPLK